MCYGSAKLRPFRGFNGFNVPWFIRVVGGDEYDELHGEDVEEDSGRAPQHAVPDTLQYNKYMCVRARERERQRERGRKRDIEMVRKSESETVREKDGKTWRDRYLKNEFLK